MARSKSLYFYLLGLTLALDIVFIYWGYQTNPERLVQENGLIENIQAILLLFSAGLFLFNSTIGPKGERLIMLFFSFLSFAFFLREVDVEKLGLPIAFEYLFSGLGRNLLLSMLLSAILLRGFSRFRHYWQHSLAFLYSIKGVLIITTGSLLVIGDVMEGLKTLENHVLLEESFEVLAYQCLLIVGIGIFFEIKLPQSNTETSRVSPPLPHKSL